MFKGDITYCDNILCPFHDCKRHPDHLIGYVGLVSISNMSGVCERYITWLVNEVSKDE